MKWFDQTGLVTITVVTEFTVTVIRCVRWICFAEALSSAHLSFNKVRLHMPQGASERKLERKPVTAPS
jgi:hypothetical protein